MRAQYVRVWCGAIGGHHHRDDDLAPLGILGADHHTIAHRRMLDEHVLGHFAPSRHPDLTEDDKEPG